MMLVGILAAQRVGPPAPANILTNGTFDDASGWTLHSATIGGGLLRWQPAGRGDDQGATHALSATVPNGSKVRVSGQRTAVAGVMTVSVLGSGFAGGGADLPLTSGSFVVEFIAGGNIFQIVTDGAEDGGTLDNVNVQAMIANLLTNGDFAQAADGWTTAVRSSPGGQDSQTGTTDRVTFNDGAAQLKLAGRGSTASGVIKRPLNVAPTPGVTYRVTFNYSGAVKAGEQSTDTFKSTVDLGSTRVRIDPLITAAAGTLTVDVTATTDDPTFSIWSGAGSNTNGLNVDNIVVTKL